MCLGVFRCSDGDFSPSGSPVFFFLARPPDRRRTPPTSCGCCLNGGPKDRCRAADLTLSSPDVYDGIHMQGRAAFCGTALYRRTTAAAAGRRPREGIKERRTVNSVPKIHMYHTRKTNRVYPEHLTGAVVSYWRARCSLWHHKRSIFTSVDISLWLVESLAMSGGFNHSLERRFPKLVGVSVQQCRSGRMRFELIVLIKTVKAVLFSVFKSKNTLYSPQKTVCVSLRWWETVIVFSLSICSASHLRSTTPWPCVLQQGP